jgi:hypothetical protein
MYNMVLYLCVLIVFSLHRESLKLILATDPLPRWFCHSYSTRMQAEEAYQAFLEHIVEKGEHVSNKWCWKYWVILVQFVVIAILLSCDL